MNIIAPVLEKISKIRKIKFLVICNAAYKNTNFEVENISWSATHEYEDLRLIDIGLYPLEKEEWVLGKSGNKALAYMNLGIPCIATNYGTNQVVIEHGENGFLADDASDWQKYILQLIDDVELRKSIGTKAKQSVEAKYSVQKNTQAYLDLITK